MFFVCISDFLTVLKVSEILEFRLQDEFSRSG